MLSVGVIIGRFQVDTFHNGHHELIKEVMLRHKKVLIFLGISPVKISERDPLDYHVRELMIQSLYPTVRILPLMDQPSDRGWSDRVDEAIKDIYPMEEPILYGSRKSFIPHYLGKFKTVLLDHVEEEISGSDIRDKVAETVLSTDDFRRGIIYATMNRYPISYQVIDVAVLKGPLNDPLILLCRKHQEREPGRLGFIGGFVDPTDPSLEYAVRREVDEETGIDIDGIRYLGSARIDDWRYKDRKDQMMSAFFIASYTSGLPKPKDDIAYVEWIPWRMALTGIQDDPMLISNHRILGDMLNKYIEQENNL